MPTVLRSIRSRKQPYIRHKQGPSTLLTSPSTCGTCWQQESHKTAKKKSQSAGTKLLLTRTKLTLCYSRNQPNNPNSQPKCPCPQSQSVCWSPICHRTLLRLSFSTKKKGMETGGGSRLAGSDSDCMVFSKTTAYTDTIWGAAVRGGPQSTTKTQHNRHKGHAWRFCTKDMNAQHTYRTVWASLLV